MAPVSRRHCFHLLGKSMLCPLDTGYSWVEDMIGNGHACKAIAKTRWT